MILVPRYQDTEIPLPPIGVRMEGWISLKKGKGSIITGEIPAFKNIITNNGLDGVADNNVGNRTAYCHVGTGTSAEAATDTALGTFVGAEGVATSTSTSAEASSPYYMKYVRTWRFDPGEATGNISEVGFSSQATTGGLFSRALVKDGGGSPTTITVLSDEWLDVTYEFRLYPGHTSADATGSISFSGSSKNYTLRAAQVTDVTKYGAAATQAVLANNGGGYGYAYGSDGALGAVTSTPTGTSQDFLGTGGCSISAATYSNGTYNRNVTLTIGLSEGNTTGGIKALLFYTKFATYQISFDTVVAKDNTKVMTFVTNLAWARATIP